MLCFLPDEVVITVIADVGGIRDEVTIAKIHQHNRCAYACIYSIYFVT